MEKWEKEYEKKFNKCVRRSAKIWFDIIDRAIEKEFFKMSMEKEVIMNLKHKDMEKEIVKYIREKAKGFETAAEDIVLKIEEGKEYDEFVIYDPFDEVDLYRVPIVKENEKIKKEDIVSTDTLEDIRVAIDLLDTIEACIDKLNCLGVITTPPNFDFNPLMQVIMTKPK